MAVPTDRRPPDASLFKSAHRKLELRVAYSAQTRDCENWPLITQPEAQALLDVFDLILCSCPRIAGNLAIQPTCGIHGTQPCNDRFLTRVRFK